MIRPCLALRGQNTAGMGIDKCNSLAALPYRYRLTLQTKARSSRVTGSTNDWFGHRLWRHGLATSILVPRNRANVRAPKSTATSSFPSCPAACDVAPSIRSACETNAKQEVSGIWQGRVDSQLSLHFIHMCRIGDLASSILPGTTASQRAVRHLNPCRCKKTRLFCQSVTALATAPDHLEHPQK